MSNARTLQQYLRLPNPVLTTSKRYIKKSKNTNTKTNPDLDEPQDINEWTDFPSGVLLPKEEEVLRNVLQQSFDETALPDYSDIQEFPLCQIFDEDSFETLVMRWNQAVVLKALAVGHDGAKAVAEKDGYHWPRHKIYMARGGQSFFIDSSRTSFPDWAGIRRGDRDDNGLFRNVLPGETKRSHKWDHKCLSNFARQDKNEENPTIQLYNYCLAAKTSYGYIITDEELVVFFVNAEEQSLEWKAVKWNHQPGEISINEALWWLHMMALLETDRPSRSAPAPSADASVTSSFKGKSPTPPPPTKHQIAVAQRSPKRTRSQRNREGR